MMLLLFVFAACVAETADSGSAAPSAAQPAVSSPAPAPAIAAAPAGTSSDAASDGEAVEGTWTGQIRLEPQSDLAAVNYVGAESGDFVPMRFRKSSAVGAKLLAVCADDDLCEFEGAVRFLDETPPEDASAVAEILLVDRVKQIPPNAM